MTVVFEAELELLRLQALSISKYVSPSGIQEILVIDNTSAKLSRRWKKRLTGAYGRFAPVVRFIRPNEIGRIVAVSGWRAQQALKLLVADNVSTSWYLTLDAKVHFIGDTSAASFFGNHGLPRGGVHSYRRHPLLPMLKSVLNYLDLDPDAFVDGFTSTATPFLLRAETVRCLMSDIGRRNPGGFAAEFERAALTEYFLYTAWQLAQGQQLSTLTTGESIESATIWPGSRTSNEVAHVLAATHSSKVASLAVHRTALARMSAAARDQLAQFWCERELFTSLQEAHAFIRRFRRAYYPAMINKKMRELGRRGIR
ncbi:DUF6492 family protein [Microbacterium sp. STN6]|uniref:DUF6492 family protein n=1 Tax=Microbacterium sp. STN6 TaxID=2995588 RepID=UPI002260C0D3|nr:DUF6492 family protein [Microbacterium sp. STN6]MCX7523036.1 DUF6492 family protein [Microbacterium sp. STN6]